MARVAAAKILPGWPGLQPSSCVLTFLRIPGICSVSSALPDLPSHLRPTPKELTLLSTRRALWKKHPGPSQAEASTWVLQHVFILLQEQILSRPLVP